MQTVVLQACRPGLRSEERESARARVESHYRTAWAQPPVCQEAHSASVSMVLWDSAQNPASWPAWHRSATATVASIYVPLGFEQLTGSVSMADAPSALAEALLARPAGILELAAPFVLARLSTNPDTLDLLTDALGIGRLFEVRTPSGWVWSNRPVAALLYAGLPARREEAGWAQSAVADEFFGVTTPYAGVTAVDAATSLHWDGWTARRTVSRVDVVASWSTAPSVTGVRDRLWIETAESLRSMATSISRLFPEQPVVDLSGGRDSRLVASAFVAAGADVVLHSHDGVPGDLVTARELVARLQSPPEHRIRHMPSGGRTLPRRFSAVESARRWHRHAEGLRPCSFIMHATPRHLDTTTTVVIGGVGGEIAHGYFYPVNLEALERLPLAQKVEAFTGVILARHTSVPGSSPEARARVESHVHAVLTDIAAQGITDARMLDFYYLRERMRRWGTTGEALGVVSPLLSPSFLRAALSLSPADRSANVLHRGITRELVPQWADVPYFPSETMAAGASTPHSAPPPRILRMADSADADEFTGLLADPDSWGGPFDVPFVHTLWHRSVEGRTTAREEQTLRRAAWSGTFEDHLARVNRTEPPVRVPARVPRGSTAPGGERQRDDRRPLAGPRLVATLRRHPAVRAVVRTRPFRAVWHSHLGRRVHRRLTR